MTGRPALLLFRSQRERRIQPQHSPGRETRLRLVHRGM
jgi:hypothetical protein